MIKLSDLRIAVLLKYKHFPEIGGELILCPIVKLRHAVVTDFFYRRYVGAVKAVRFGFGHFIFLCLLIVGLAHFFHNAVQNFLLSGIVLVKSRLCNSQLMCNIAH